MARFAEGQHYERLSSGNLDWTGAGLAELRLAGWSGHLRDLPTVESVITSKGHVASRPEQTNEATMTNSATAARERIAAILRLPEAKGQAVAAERLALSSDVTVEDARVILGNGSIAPTRTPAPSTSSMAVFAAGYWRDRRSQAAPTARPSAQPAARTQGRLPDPADVFARRRTSAGR